MLTQVAHDPPADWANPTPERINDRGGFLAYVASASTCSITSTRATSCSTG